MMKQKRFLLFAVIIPLCILLSSWGWVGHQKISLNISLSFTEEMSQFNDWVPFLKEHASDADNRKSTDPAEGPKHYIDIDAYPEFNSTGEIHTSLDTCIARHGSGFVEDQGYLPWATLNTYNDIVEAMKKGEWEEAKIAAADLGHYVADGFMPLHITLNYDGQLTGNHGIHRRYESYMIGDYQDQITYDGSPVEEIEDIPAYIFGYIYQNYQWVDDLIAADDKAKAADATYGNLYLETLWNETGAFTIELFKGASHAFANLLYNAWREAGKPELQDESLYISEETAYLPDYIGVSYSELGIIYLVPENTNKDIVHIRSACLDSTNAMANIEVKIPLNGLNAGNYWLYARSYQGALSGPVMFSVTASAIQSPFVESAGIYPNPITQTANICFTLQKRDYVSVKVIDATGRLTETIQSGELPGGAYRFLWTADNVPSGAYYVLIEGADDRSVFQFLKK